MNRHQFGIDEINNHDMYHITIDRFKANNFKDKYNMSTPNLLFDLKNQKNKNKEQSCKIFNDNILISNNTLYNNIKNNANNNNNKSCDRKENSKNNYKGITAKNSPRKNSKLPFDSFEEKKNQNLDKI